jgi:hypothetical protein
MQKYRGGAQPDGGEDAPGWICPVCGVKNHLGAVNCFVCGEPRVAAPPVLEDAGGGGGAQPDAPGWICPVCGLKNDLVAENCGACNNARPAGAVWECPTCGLLNNSDTANCGACEDPRPGIAPAAADAGGGGGGGGGGAPAEEEQWWCPRCTLNNPLSAAICGGCGGKRIIATELLDETKNDLEKRLKCPVCMANKNNIALQPCGHSMCNVCAPNLVPYDNGDGKGLCKRCPICRASINSYANLQQGGYYNKYKKYLNKLNN